MHVVVPDGLSIGAAEARELVRVAGRAPSQGRWQVILVEDADRMTEQASNAVLKMIEEPPPRTVVMLCAPSLHPDDVPVTIRSRCRRGRRCAPRRSTPSPTSSSRRDGVDPALAAWSAGAAGGHVGRARRLARDEDARLARKAVLDVPLSLVSLAACLDAADDLVGAAAGGGRRRHRRPGRRGDRGGQGQPRRRRPRAGRRRRQPGRRAAQGARAEAEVARHPARPRLPRPGAGRPRRPLPRRSRAATRPPASRRSSTTPTAGPTPQELARRIGAEGALRRIDAVLACRLALEQNVKPRIALEALTVALRLPA